MARESGILLHISSLPSDYGIGDLDAFEFIDFLVDSGQKVWQILPINPTDLAYENSPYYSYSAYAGNTLFISPKLLVEQGFLKKEELYPKPKFLDEKVNYKEVTEYKEKLFDITYNRHKENQRYSLNSKNLKIFLNFLNPKDLRIFLNPEDLESPKELENYKTQTPSDECYLHDYEKFCIENSHWLEDFALFTSLKSKHSNTSWTKWQIELRNRCEKALGDIKNTLYHEIEKEKFLQYLFFKQWNLLKNYCKKKGIRIIGDMPIYVIHESVEVWKNPEIFKLDDEGNPIFVAGVPPDYFSKTGQYWGNPVYNWAALKESEYVFWINRIAHSLKLFDLIRIDHFRGFIDYWEIPVNKNSPKIAESEKTAIHGKWAKAQPFEFFSIIFKNFPSLPFIAEDLGIITQEVIEVINKFNLHGMKVLLFAFEGDLSTNPHTPHNHKIKCVVYTGTHDNNTVRGWFEKEATNENKEKFFNYIGRKVSIDEIHWEFIRLALSSVADLAIIPLQDVLGSNDRCRMNIPATIKGNWEWRVTKKGLTNEISLKLLKMTCLYGRC